jgi:hypothetical protein
MSEEWRKRNYYRPRVLVGVDDTLNCTYPGGVVCLSGAQLNIIRNVLAYAHRRANWVSDYYDDYYLVPDNDDWDSVQAIVAELEDSLMSCEEIGEQLGRMGDALECICHTIGVLATAGQPADPGYEEQPYYDDRPCDVTPHVGNPPPPFLNWEEWDVYVCIAAQKLVDDLRDAVIEMGVAIRSGTIVSFSVVNGWLVLTVISIPVSIVILVVTILIALGITWAYEAVVTWIEEHKTGLVCAIYNGTDMTSAYDAVQAYIADNWDAGSGQNLVQSLITRTVIGEIYEGLARGYTAWSGGYSEEFCLYCEELPHGEILTETWPPCPADMFLDGGVCYNGRLSFNADVDPAHQPYIVDLTEYTKLHIETTWHSRFNAGWTVGSVVVHRWDAEGNDWSYVWQHTLTNTVDAGGENWDDEMHEFGASLPGGLHRIVLQGQEGQHDVDPYPMMLDAVSVTWYVE